MARAYGTLWHRDVTVRTCRLWQVRDNDFNREVNFSGWSRMVREVGALVHAVKAVQGLDE